MITTLLTTLLTGGLLATGFASCAATPAPGEAPADLHLVLVAPTDDPMVEIAAEDPRIRVRAVYATPDNFVGETLYPVGRIYLRQSAMKRLSRVQDDLEADGLGLLVFDGYRPWSVTKRMWDVIGDPDFVADPSKGSRHNRGMAVDLALVDANGRALPMPTQFDAFVPEARADAAVLEPMRRNRDRLIEAMAAHGFAVLSSEWWHFDADGWQEKSLLNVPIEELAASR
ncbi:MAG: D-alanyl-D-alanine dipeptidase [Planctomycetota bacterium]|jgi:D-alanyl-D-alanine dipeptidase